MCFFWILVFPIFVLIMIFFEITNRNQQLENTSVIGLIVWFVADYYTRAITEETIRK